MTPDHPQTTKEMLVKAQNKLNAWHHQQKVYGVSSKWGVLSYWKKLYKYWKIWENAGQVCGLGLGRIGIQKVVFLKVSDEKTMFEYIYIYIHISWFYVSRYGVFRITHHSFGSIEMKCRNNTCNKPQETLIEWFIHIPGDPLWNTPLTSKPLYSFKLGCSGCF